MKDVMNIRIPSASGFTLVELLMTIVIAAILLAIGVPSFRAVLENNRMASQANELLTSITYARSEAIKRGAVVSISPGDGLDYVNGWCVHTGADCTAVATVLRVFPAMPGMAVTVSSGAASVLVFNGQGQKTAPAGVVTIDLQPDGCVAGTANRARAIEIAATGRAMVETGACQ